MDTIRKEAVVSQYTYYPDTSLHALRKTIKKWARTASVSAEIRTENL
jgi:hypothetical protein